ncbi:hypothetical protein FKP32DRAFT_1681041 [Trametes sanguinea]|nr:hypothetical protein FKP32DRAFT_1681041 [Trametes sanguinea]
MSYPPPPPDLQDETLVFVTIRDFPTSQHSIASTAAFYDVTRIEGAPLAVGRAVDLILEYLPCGGMMPCTPSPDVQYMSLNVAGRIAGERTCSQETIEYVVYNENRPAPVRRAFLCVRRNTGMTEDTNLADVLSNRIAEIAAVNPIRLWPRVWPNETARDQLVSPANEEWQAVPQEIAATEPAGARPHVTVGTDSMTRSFGTHEQQVQLQHEWRGEPHRVPMLAASAEAHLSLPPMTSTSAPPDGWRPAAQSLSGPAWPLAAAQEPRTQLAHVSLWKQMMERRWGVVPPEHVPGNVAEENRWYPIARYGTGLRSDSDTSEPRGWNNGTA